MLSPLAELEHAPADIAERGWRSLDLWPGIVAALGPRTDTPACSAATAACSWRIRATRARRSACSRA